MGERAPKPSSAPLEEDFDLDVVPPDRLVMLSDGVFAIAMTLLALDLIPPSTELLHSEALLAVLLGSWPSVMSFIISFWVISVYWRAHTDLFRWIERCDRRIVRLNLLLLLLICFLPFPTAILGDHGPETPAVTFYALSVIATCLVEIGLCADVFRRPFLLRPGAPRHLVGGIILRSTVTATVFGSSALIALFDPMLAMLSWIISPIVGHWAQARFMRRRTSI